MRRVNARREVCGRNVGKVWGFRFSFYMNSMGGQGHSMAAKLLLHVASGVIGQSTSPLP